MAVRSHVLDNRRLQHDIKTGAHLLQSLYPRLAHLRPWRQEKEQARHTLLHRFNSLMYKLFTILCVLNLPCLFSTLPVVAEPVHFPIRRSSKPRGIEHYAEVADRLRQKYGYSSSTKHRRQSSQAIPITNQVSCPQSGFLSTWCRWAN